MRILFPSNPLDPKAVDPAFAAELDAARAAGFETILLYAEDLDDGAFGRAVRRCAETAEAMPALYRGWMLTADAYSSARGTAANLLHAARNCSRPVST
jgi:hypothetical protein